MYIKKKSLHKHLNYYSFAIRKANHNANEIFWLVKVTRAGAHTVAEFTVPHPCTANIHSPCSYKLPGGGSHIRGPWAALSTVLMHHFEHSSVLSGPVHMKCLSIGVWDSACLCPRILGNSPIRWLQWQSWWSFLEKRKFLSKG